MLIQEAEIVGQMLENVIRNMDRKVTILNIGSSTGYFRSVVQPHIDDLIFRPLNERNHRVYHVDIKKDDGVDYCGDITSFAFRSELRTLNPDVILCCNILEHVSDIQEFCDALSDLSNHSFLLITCPRDYPYHPDPLDNGFRPAAEDIAAKFPRHSLVASKYAVGETLKDRFDTWSATRKIRFAVAVLKGIAMGGRQIKLPQADGPLPSILSYWRRPFSATAALLKPL